MLPCATMEHPICILVAPVNKDISLEHRHLRLRKYILSNFWKKKLAHSGIRPPILALKSLVRPGKCNFLNQREWSYWGSLKYIGVTFKLECGHFCPMILSLVGGIVKAKATSSLQGASCSPPALGRPESRKQDFQEAILPRQC